MSERVSIPENLKTKLLTVIIKLLEAMDNDEGVCPPVYFALITLVREVFNNNAAQCISNIIDCTDDHYYLPFDISASEALAELLVIAGKDD